MYNTTSLLDNLEFDFYEYVKLIGHKSPVTAIKVLQNKKVLSGSKDGEIIIWEWSDKRNSIELKSKLNGHTDQISQIIISNDNRTLVTSSFDHTIRIWDLESENYECKRILIGHTDKVVSILLDYKQPDNLVLISTSHDQTVKIWNIENGTCMYTKAQIFQTEMVVSCGIIDKQNNKEGSLLIYCGTRGNIQRWNYKNGGAGHPDEKDGNWVSIPPNENHGPSNHPKTNGFLLSPDSSLLVLTSFDETIDENLNYYYEDRDENLNYYEDQDSNKKHQSILYMYEIESESLMIAVICKEIIRKLIFSPTRYLLFTIFNESVGIYSLLNWHTPSKLNEPIDYKINQDDIKSNIFEFQTLMPKLNEIDQHQQLSKYLSIDVDENNCIYVGNENNSITVFKSNTTMVT